MLGRSAPTRLQTFERMISTAIATQSRAFGRPHRLARWRLALPGCCLALAFAVAALYERSAPAMHRRSVGPVQVVANHPAEDHGWDGAWGPAQARTGLGAAT
jgi:hypothetical protein